MKHSLTIISFCLFAAAAIAQTKIEKTFPLQGAKELRLDLDHPNVKIQTWDKNEVLVKGTVSINHGENDAAFELQSAGETGVLSITSFIKDKESIPRHTMIKKGEQEYYFKAKDWNDPEIKKFIDENGGEYSYMTNGIIIDINLEVFVPRNFRTTVNAKHGIVEFTQFDGPLRIDAKHGKVDATIPGTIGELTVRSRYGEIMSNLDIKFDQQPFDTNRKGNSWTELTAHPGKGVSYWIESKHGIIYLRKP
jgi:hypothetical protein